MSKRDDCVELIRGQLAWLAEVIATVEDEDLLQELHLDIAAALELIQISMEPTDKKLMN